MINTYDWEVKQLYGFSISSIGYNPLAIFLCAIVEGFMVCLLLRVSSRKYKSEYHWQGLAVLLSVPHAIPL